MILLFLLIIFMFISLMPLRILLLGIMFFFVGIGGLGLSWHIEGNGGLYVDGK